MPESNAPAGTSGVFVNTLAAMNNGQVLTDLDDALREVTKSALAATSKAKLTLELTVMPNGAGAGDVPLIKVVDKIKVSTPKPARNMEPVFFADEDFNPTRRNPRQTEMKLEALDGGKAPTLKVQTEAKASGQ